MAFFCDDILGNRGDAADSVCERSGLGTVHDKSSCLYLSRGSLGTSPEALTIAHNDKTLSMV